MDLSKLIDWIKLPTKYLFAVSIVCGLLLFSPVAWIKSLGLDSFINLWRPWLGTVFLVTAVLCILDVVIKMWKWWSRKLKDGKIKKLRIERLKKLTAEEKEILLGFVLNKTKTQYLACADGVVKGLEVENIIFQSSNVGDLERWSYNIQPWAWGVINENIDSFFTEEDIRAFEVSGLTPSEKSARRANPLFAFSDLFRRK